MWWVGYDYVGYQQAHLEFTVGQKQKNSQKIQAFITLYLSVTSTYESKFACFVSIIGIIYNLQPNKTNVMMKTLVVFYIQLFQIGVILTTI